jgi:hypothetical protein
MTQTLLHLSLALFLFLLGCLIKYGKVDWMIAGYNTSSKEEKGKFDVEALCQEEDNFLFTLGGTMLIPATARNPFFHKKAYSMEHY